MGFVLGANPIWQFTNNAGKYLAFGSVTFQNWNTRQPKPVYRDPNGQTVFDNPAPLDAIGQIKEIYFADDAPYYFEVKDRNNALIYATATPYVPGAGGGGGGTTNIDIENLFINGQFRYFSVAEYGPNIPTSIPNLARGGWSYEKDGTGTQDTLKFERFTLDNTDVDASPVYYLRYTQLAIVGDQTKSDVSYTVPDVRTLANEQITVSFWQRDFVGDNPNVEVLYVQHFGTGGSPSPDNVVLVSPVATTNAWEQKSVTFTIDDLSGKSLGTNGDDYFKIIIRQPIGVVADVGTTNAYWKRGIAVNEYPYYTSSETLAEIKAYELPDYRPFTDLDPDVYAYPEDEAYASITLKPGPNGTLSPAWIQAFPVGAGLFWHSKTFTPAGFVDCKGQEVLKPGKYLRLYNTFAADGFWGGLPEDNLQSENTPGNTYVDLINSKRLEATQAAAGTSGFTVTRLTKGEPTHINVTSQSGNVATFTNLNNGLISPPVNAETSGLTFNVISSGSASTPASWSVTAKAASDLTPGAYFNFGTPLGSFSVYFIIDGVGTDPMVPLHTSVPVYFSAAETAPVVRLRLARAVSGIESSRVAPIAAASIVPGSYFTLGITSGTDYAFWAAINGAGTAPTVVGHTNVRLDFALTDSAATVATKIAAQIAPLLFYLPETRGEFFRAVNDGRASGGDPNAATRFALHTGGPTGDNPGSYQGSMFETHEHTYTKAELGGAGTGGATGKLVSGEANIATSAVASGTSGPETRPRNWYIVYLMKY